MTPLLSFYGDDFTGTVATAQLLSSLGVSTVVFPRPPSRSHLDRHFPEVAAVGIAGTARAWPVDEMGRQLRPALEAVKTLGAPMVLYKISSTFDSSPEIGSVGRAIEIGRAVYSTGLVPLIPAAPKMGRMTVFGNHFAEGDDGRIHRLDRQPSMANHPVTPMGEADLLRHLAKQTRLPSGLVDVRALEGGAVDVAHRVKSLESDGVAIALFDVLFDRHLALACETLWDMADAHPPLFVVGSHELGEGLGRVIRDRAMAGSTAASPPSIDVSEPGPLLAVSGSCSTMTRLQLLDAIDSGFFEVAVDVDAICDPARCQREERRIVAVCRDRVDAGQSVVVHTCMGADDPRIDALDARVGGEARLTPELHDDLGHALGRVTAEVLRLTGLRRVAVAGGDTSGRVLAHLRVGALVLDTASVDRDPVCYIRSDDTDMDGVQVALKGGQTGGVHYFTDIRDARMVDSGDVESPLEMRDT